MLLYDLMWAGSALCVKYVGSQVYFPQIVSYESFGVALGGLLIFIVIPKIRTSSQNLMRTISLSTLLLLCINEGVLYLLARALLNYAYTLGSASIVSVLESTQIVFVLIAGAILSLWRPKIFRENTDRKILIKKILYAINVIVGIGLFSR
jgi:drug/metabolite transporter (DMT)-like permease